MIGKTLGHDKIESKLGHGGMGVVNKARDLYLDRPVAIKVLPPEAVADHERKRRFVQEAKAASALNHPNILHVYDIDTAGPEEGRLTDFIAMEYVPRNESSKNTSPYFRTAVLSDPIPVAWLPGGDRVVFTARFGDSLNVYLLSISPEKWKVTGEPQRLTFGKGLQTKPSIAASPGGDLRLVFAGLLEQVNIWGLPIDADQGQPASCCG